MTTREEARASTLASYVPRLVLDRLCTAPGPPTEPRSESFLAALLMVDITGFTRITDAAAARGAAGAEELSRALSAYLGQVIDLIGEHGGDVAKVVGDALIPVWPASEEDLGTVTLRAAACGRDIAARFGDAEMEEGLRLSLKVGLCTGDVSAVSVGGLGGRWLFLITGDAVSQLRELQPVLETREVIASPQAWERLSETAEGRAVGRGHVRLGHVIRAPAPRAQAARILAADEEGSARAYIPPVLLARLDAGQADWLAELRETTVLFTNVRGLAVAGAGGRAELGQLHALAEAGQQVLGRYDGWLKEITMDDKGTTLIGAFGVPPFTHEDDPARAVAAALALHERLRGIGLSGSSGVTTGQTFCGPWGSTRRRDFAMLGGHVNLAARLMQAAEDEAVLCDSRTRRDVADVSFDRLPAYVLKGIPTPVDVYRARPAVSDPLSLDRLVDRTDEMAVLSASLERLAAGMGGLIVLEGEPGIGKSRLITEWLVRARATGVEALFGAATEIESSTPYHPWHGIFERLLGVEAVTDPGVRGAAILDRLAADPSTHRLAPLLAPVLTADIPDDDVTRQMTGVVRADNTRDLLVGLLRQRAATSQLMVVLEDAQWFDSSSWALVGRARHEIANVLLVITTRPVADPRPERVQLLESASKRIRLRALSSADALALTALRSGARRVDERIAAVLNQRAEGNPLYIEQLTFALRDAGRIVVDHGLLRAADGAEDLDRIMPDTVQRVITTRLDQLSPGLALTLKVASVIGQRFQLSTLQHVHPVIDRGEVVSQDLEALARLDIIGRPEDPSPDPVYEFRHTVTQEVAYNLMPAGQSRQLHEALAEWFEEVYAADPSPHHAVMAHHWLRAGHLDRAASHFGFAGAQALRTFANEEAIAALDQGLALEGVGNVPAAQARTARWHLQLGEAYVNLSRYGEGREHIELGLGLMGRPVPRGRWGQGASLFGQTLRQLGHRLGAGQAGRRPDDRQRDELVAICRAYERLAEASYYGRETLLPLYCVVRILNEAEDSGSAPEIARGLAGTGALFGLVPLARIADRYLSDALGRLEDVDDLETHEIVRIVVGFYHAGVGRWSLAREQFSAVRGIADRLGDRRRLQDAVGNLGEIACLEGSFGLAAALTDELLDLARAHEDRRFEAEALALRAYCAWQRGETALAHESLGALQESAVAIGLPDELLIKRHGIEALIRLADGDRSAAVAASEAALDLTTRQRPTYATYIGHVAPAEVFLDLWELGAGDVDLQARAGRALARMSAYARIFSVGRARCALLEGRRAWLVGRQDEARRRWNDALDLAQQHDMPYEEAIVHHEIGRRLRADDDDRRAHLQTAQALFARLGAARDAARIASDPSIDPDSRESR